MITRTPPYLFILMLVILSFSNVVFSQNSKEIDSLKTVLANFEAQKKELGPGASPKIDTLKVRIMDHLAGAYYQGNPNTALTTALEELKLSEKLQYNWGIAQSCNILGAIYDYKNNYPLSRSYYIRSLRVKKISKDLIGMIDTYNNLGVSYSQTANYAAALDNMQKGLEIAKKLHNGFGIFGSSNNIGLVYRNQGLYDQALKTYFNCLKVQANLKNDFKLNYTYYNIGDIYLIRKKTGLAMSYFEKALPYAVKNNDLEGEASIYFGMGLTFNEKKDYVSGMKNFEKALAIDLKMENPRGISDCKIIMGYTSYKLGDSKKAVALISEGLKIVTDNGVLDSMMTCYQYLAEIYAASGNYKLAYKNHVAFKEAQDSIFNMEREQKFRELQVKFDLKAVHERAKAKEIISRKELQNQKNIRNYIFLGMCIIVSFLIIVLIQRNKLAAIRRQKALDEERNRISRDLHDNLGAQLSTARMFISSLKNKTGDAQIGETVESSLDMLDSSIHDLRKIMNEMQTSVLLEKGYLAATEDLVNKINQLHLIRFTLSHHRIDGRFDHRIEHELYRITQELINNTLKYADAKHVSIDLVKRDGNLILMYEDDGKGYDPNNIRKGNGLSNIETRVKSVKGNVEFDSMPDAGARTIIEIPLKNDR